MNGENATRKTSVIEKVDKILMKNKKEIIIASGIIVSIVVDIFIKNLRDNKINDTKGFLDATLDDIVNSSIEPSAKIINVRDHLRNLPNGHKASETSKGIAMNNGIKLNENQTFVNSYTKSTYK